MPPENLPGALNSLSTWNLKYIEYSERKKILLKLYAIENINSSTLNQANTTMLLSDCSRSVTCLGNGRIKESSSCPIGSDCLVEFGERMCKCPEGYAPLNGKCKSKLNAFITYLIDCMIGILFSNLHSL